MIRKTILNVFLLFFTLVVQSQDLKKHEVETNKIIELTPADSWEIVNDFSNLNLLVPEVVTKTEVFGEGLESSWDINLTNQSVVKEKMVYYSDSERTMSYIMTETPMPIRDYVAIIKVEPYGVSKSLVSFYTSCKVSELNRQNILNSFRSFQETYLSNLKNLKL